MAYYIQYNAALRILIAIHWVKHPAGFHFVPGHLICTSTAWQQADRPLDGAELVLWPIVGVHHYPKPEEWPIMPVHRIGLRFEPDGFFTRNPSLDLPESSGGDHCHGPTAGGAVAVGHAFHGHEGGGRAHHDHSAHGHEHHGH